MTFANKFFLFKNETYIFIQYVNSYTILNYTRNWTRITLIHLSRAVDAEQMICNFSYSVPVAQQAKSIIGDISIITVVILYYILINVKWIF